MAKEKRYKDQQVNPYDDNEYGYEGKPVCDKCGRTKVKGICPSCKKLKNRYGKA